MTPAEHKPPRWALAFFRWFCNPAYKEDIEGDLLERFHNRAVINPNKAKWLFMLEVFRLWRPGIAGTSKNELSKPNTMKLFNWIQFTGIHLLVVLFNLSPFIPGPSNELVMALSMAGGFFTGFCGVLLLPVTIAWIISEYYKWTKQGSSKTSYTFAVIVTILLTIGYALLTFILFNETSMFTGIWCGLCGVVLFYLVIPKIRQLKQLPAGRFVITPLYLLSIPVVAFITQFYLVDPASDYSRNKAIKKGESLIASIEEYQTTFGEYPASLQELDKVPSTSIMGIQPFRYNKIGDRYSLSFSQWKQFGSLEEIVLFDKHDLHQTHFPFYNYQLDLQRVKGAFARYDTQHENWKYYYLD